MPNLVEMELIRNEKLHGCYRPLQAATKLLFNYSIYPDRGDSEKYSSWRGNLLEKEVVVVR